MGLETALWVGTGEMPMGTESWWGGKLQATGTPGAELVVALTVALCWCASIFLSSSLDTMAGSQANLWLLMG